MQLQYRFLCSQLICLGEGDLGFDIPSKGLKNKAFVVPGKSIVLIDPDSLVKCLKGLIVPAPIIIFPVVPNYKEPWPLPFQTLK